MKQTETLEQVIARYRIHHCLDCGKCTGACPPARVDSGFSPRLFAREVVTSGLDSPYVREKVWTCLTCNLCLERCPSGIAFADFIQTLRSFYVNDGLDGHVSHGGALHSLMRMQAAPELVQRRTDWMTPDLETADRGEILYFAGCIPYFDIFFSDLALNLTDIPRAAVKILNAAGIRPVVLENERCCGHDLYWSGDTESFVRLRDLNLKAFRDAGAKTIVTACAECSYCLKTLYSESGAETPFTVRHLSEYVTRLEIQPKSKLNETAVYQDPCRLARFQGVIDPPREILRNILDLREMAHHGTGAWCCGNSAWMNCNRYSKLMQVDRLMEADAAGAETIVTACPKCGIHLACAMRDPNLLKRFTFKIKDLACLTADTLSGGDR